MSICQSNKDFSSSPQHFVVTFMENNNLQTVPQFPKGHILDKNDFVKPIGNVS